MNTIQTLPGVRTAVDELRAEFQKGGLTLYLGAGVSIDSGLPSWSTLLATLYYTAVNNDWAEKWKPYPNYLYALGEWLLKQSGEPPEVIAGKVERYIKPPEDFQKQLTETLYLRWKDAASGKLVPPTAQALRSQNRLLDAVAGLCEKTTVEQGLGAVVTTNYDSLLEQALSDSISAVKFEPLWKASQKLNRGKDKGIFHVHGYLPPDTSGSSQREILLTESQYHEAASDPYSWSNLSMIQCFSATTSLMVGMSMTDRNLRRLLNALSRTQLRKDVYLVLKEAKMPEMTDCDVDLVNKNAAKYASRFPDSGAKMPKKVKEDLTAILGGLVSQEKAMTEKTLKGFGVKPIWVNDYPDIPKIIDAVGEPKW